MLMVDGLTKRYGEVVALDGCSFVAREGRITGFLGPNGARKTTPMRTVFGLLLPDAGRISWRGHLIGRAERRRFGYMPEERGLYPKMRVRDQLVHFGFVAGLTLALLGSMFPATAPMMMPARSAVSDVAAWQIVLTLVLEVAAIVVLVRLGGRLYRGSILRVGRKLTLREAWHATT